MKTFDAGLAAHYALATTTLARCIEITRADGAVYRYTDAQRDLTVGADTYLAGPGLVVGDIASAAGLAVDNLELTITPDDAAITRADILAGFWDGAAFSIFETNYLDTAGGINILRTGTFGEIRLERSRFVVELRGLAQALQQPVGDVTSKTCRYRLGDDRCTVDLAPFTHTGTVTSVTSAQVFTASALGQAADYYVEGTITFTSGLNDGITRKVRAFSSGKQFTTSLPFPYAVAVSDTFSAVAGCQKRHAEDCETKFSNILNFGGEPHIPGIDALTAPPEVDVP